MPKKRAVATDSPPKPRSIGGDRMASISRAGVRQKAMEVDHWRLPGGYLEVSPATPSRALAAAGKSIRQAPARKKAASAPSGGDGAPKEHVIDYPILTLASLREVTASSIPRVIDIFNTLDADHGGTVSQSEFINGMLTCFPQVRDLLISPSLHGLLLKPFISL